MSPLVTVYVSIGNSDDKLSQAGWHAYWTALRSLVTGEYAEHVHGEWLSAPADPFQNGCICFEVSRGAAGALQAALRRLAAEFGQDFIAWAEARTQFLGPPPDDAA